MRNRSSELDMAHTIASDLGERDFDAALLANDSTIFHALVLAAQALIVFDRSKNAGAKQAIPLWLEGPIVDRLRLFDLAIRPRADALRASDRNANLIEALRPADLAEDVHQLVHERPLLWSVVTPTFAAATDKETLASLARPNGIDRQYPCCSSSTLRPSERNSFTSTLKDSGMPASKLSSPRTIASWTFVRPETSSDLTVSISCKVYAAP